MKKTSFFLSLFFFVILVAKGQTTVTGALVGHDGKPMIKAHVHMMKAGQAKPVASVEAAEDGRYNISTNEIGLFIAQYTGVDHGHQDDLLVTDKPTVARIDVNLATYKYADDFSTVKIIGDFNNFSFQTAKDMNKQSDGTFMAEFETKTDKFRYQLYGIAGNRSINGTESEDFEYDGSTDYRSIVTPKDGKVTIVFDPKKLVRSNVVAEVRFENPTSTAARAAAIYRDLQRRRQDFQRFAIGYLKAGKDMKEFKYDWTMEFSAVSFQIKQEKDPVVRKLLLFSYLDIVAMMAKPGEAVPEAEEQIVKQALTEIGPESRLWGFGPHLLTVAGANSGEPNKYDEYLQQVLEKNPDDNLKASLLWNKLMMAKFQNDQEKVKKYYDLLTTQYADSPYSRMAKERITPESKIAIGKTVPRFSLVSMENPKTTYTDESFKGKVYLIDFWAVWCGPCVAEMENLHKAYERFKSKNFEILSLSFDQKPEDVTKFRQGKWKMPWRHVFMEKGFEHPVAKEFEVIGIPKPILVDGNTGKILAMEMELRGQNLERTLSKTLAEPQ